MKLTLSLTTGGWFPDTGQVAWFHHRDADEQETGLFGAVCIRGEDFRALGSPEFITITIEAGESDDV